MYTYDRDEVDVYSIVNVKDMEDMTVGSATDTIVSLLQNTQKNEGKQLIAKNTQF